MSEASLAGRLRPLLDRAGTQPVEIVTLEEEYTLTRFRRGTVHQSVSRSGKTAVIRALVDGRLGQVLVSVADADAISRAIRDATALARAAGSPTGLESLGSTDGRDLHVDLAAALPDARARSEAVRTVITYAKGQGLAASGAYVTYKTTVTVGASPGRIRETITSSAYLRTVVESDRISGYAEQLATDYRDLNPEAAAREAAAKALVPGDPVTLPAGEYDLILDRVAVADWLRFLGVYGFNGQAATNGSSFLRDVWGQQVAPPMVTIWDDATDTDGLRMPFDFEGTLKTRTALITEGRIEAPVYDRATAALAGKASTGHANSPFGLQLLPGPAPFHWHMAAGKESLEAMVTSTSRGLLITRMNYTDLSDRRRGVLTAPTRDGTFLIEDGELRPTADVRITDSLLGMLARVVGVGDTPRLVYDWWNPMHSYSMSYRVPPVKIAACCVSGASVLE